MNTSLEKSWSVTIKTIFVEYNNALNQACPLHWPEAGEHFILISCIRSVFWLQPFLQVQKIISSSSDSDGDNIIIIGFSISFCGAILEL